jgi:hypothetical protein
VVEDCFKGLDVAAMGELRPVDHRGARAGGVLAAQFGRVHVELPGQEVDRPLDVVGGFRSAGSAVGADRGSGRVDGADVEVDGRDVVATDRHRRGQVGQVEPLGVRAGILDDL